MTLYGDLKVKSIEAIQTPMTIKAQGRKISANICFLFLLYELNFLTSTAVKLLQNELSSLLSARENFSNSYGPSFIWGGIYFSMSWGFNDWIGLITKASRGRTDSSQFSLYRSSASFLSSRAGAIRLSNFEIIFCSVSWISGALFGSWPLLS